MSAKKILTAQVREIKGRKVKKLTKEGLLPANLFGAKTESIALSLPLKEALAMYKEAGDTQVVYIKIAGEDRERPVLFDEVQVDPIRGYAVHFALRQINLKEKVQVSVPVELIGENKIAGAVVVLVKDEIEVEALPTDLPEKFELDISQLTEIGQGISFNELSYDRNKVKLLIDEEQFDNPVVLLQEVKEEVEPEPETAVESAGSETGTGATGSGAETTSGEEVSSENA